MLIDKDQTTIVDGCAWQEGIFVWKAEAHMDENEMKKTTYEWEDQWKGAWPKEECSHVLLLIIVFSAQVWVPIRWIWFSMSETNEHNSSCILMESDVLEVN